MTAISMTDPYSLALLKGLQPKARFRNPKHVYAGTVTSKVKAKRRAANKVARVSRRVNRGH